MLFISLYSGAGSMWFTSSRAARAGSLFGNRKSHFAAAGVDILRRQPHDRRQFLAYGIGIHVTVENYIHGSRIPRITSLGNGRHFRKRFGLSGGSRVPQRKGRF
jgi:hypothetical protein